MGFAQSVGCRGVNRGGIGLGCRLERGAAHNERFLAHGGRRLAGNAKLRWILPRSKISIISDVGVEIKMVDKPRLPYQDQV